MVKKVVIAAGGTGGHIYPAIALADALKKENSDINIHFIGSDERLEKDLIPQAGYPITTIPVRQFSISSISKFFKGGISLLKSYIKSKKFLKDFSPDVVIGVGSYISVPPIIAGFHCKIPIVLLEQNVIPGKANLFLSKFAKVVAVSFESSKKFFSRNEVYLNLNFLCFNLNLVLSKIWYK